MSNNVVETLSFSITLQAEDELQKLKELQLGKKFTWKLPVLFVAQEKKDFYIHDLKTVDVGEYDTTYLITLKDVPFDEDIVVLKPRFIGSNFAGYDQVAGPTLTDNEFYKLKVVRD